MMTIRAEQPTELNLVQRVLDSLVAAIDEGCPYAPIDYDIVLNFYQKSTTVAEKTAISEPTTIREFIEAHRHFYNEYFALYNV